MAPSTPQSAYTVGCLNGSDSSSAFTPNQVGPVP
jgi:hypothetical protein